MNVCRDWLLTMPVKSSEQNLRRIVLACDTTQGACSVALWQNGKTEEILQPMQKGHAEALLPMLETLLSEAEKAGTAREAVTHLAVTNGPGTFTGVRVGLSAMRGLALALDLPLKTYGTLDVMAAGALAHKKPSDPLIVAVDAKRATFYAQGFAPDGAALAPPAALSGGDVVALAKSISDKKNDKEVALCGSGAAMLVDKWAGFYVTDAPMFPSAAQLAGIAAHDVDWGDLASAEPVYLRPPDATLPDPNKRIKWRT